MHDWDIDGDLRAYVSEPAAPVAAVLLVHGYGEHAGRHAATAARLAARNIAVFSFDQRGHGRSPGRRAFVERFDDLVADTAAMRRRVAARRPELPLFLMGVSMGGLVALRSAQRDPAGLAGVVLVAPALAIGQSAPRLPRAAGTLLARLWPALPVAELDLAALSRDPSVAAAYAADPLVYHGKVAARTGAELMAAAAAAQRAAPRWRLPAYVVAGEADRIAAVGGAQRFAAAAGPTVTLRLVPGGFHEPFTEPGGDELVDEVADFIAAHARPPAAAASPRPSRPAPRVYGWREGLAFGAAVNVAARLLGTNTGRYETIVRPWFAPPGWAFPVMWAINTVLAVGGNVRVLNMPPSADRTAYLRLWAVTWLLYVSFGYAFFRRKSPVGGLLVTVNFLTLTVLSAGRALRLDRRLWVSYATLLPWLVLACAVAAAVALDNPDPLLDPPAGA